MSGETGSGSPTPARSLRMSSRKELAAEEKAEKIAEKKERAMESEVLTLIEDERVIPDLPPSSPQISRLKASTDSLSSFAHRIFHSHSHANDLHTSMEKDVEDVHHPSSPRQNSTASKKIVLEVHHRHHHEHSHTHHFSDPHEVLSTQEANTLGTVPPSIIKASTFLSLNSLFMAVSEVVIEILILLSLIPKLPFRVDFFFLTALSALLGYHTLKGLKKRELDVTHDATQVSLLVEIALVVGDALFIAGQEKFTVAFAVRFPFMMLTLVNISILLFIIIRLHLLENFKSWLTGYDDKEWNFKE